jgi:hypothetical protein
MSSNQRKGLEKENHKSNLSSPAEGIEKLNNGIFTLLQELKTVLTVLNKE